MKKMIALALSLLTITNTTFSMDPNTINLYVTAQMNIKTLQQKADAGDIDSSVAIYDFFESLKNPDYKIDYDSSRKLLIKLSLLNQDGKIHQATREAFKAVETFKAAQASSINK